MCISTQFFHQVENPTTKSIIFDEKKNAFNFFRLQTFCSPIPRKRKIGLISVDFEHKNFRNLNSHITWNSNPQT